MLANIGKKPYNKSMEIPRRVSGRKEKETMTKLRCKKEYGTWFYEKELATWQNGLDAPVYHLFDEDRKFAESFGSYGDMKYFVETGIVL